MVVPSPPSGNSNGRKKRNKNAHQSNHYKATHNSGSKADRKSGGKAGKGNKSINKLFHFGQTGPHLAKHKRLQELKKAAKQKQQQRISVSNAGSKKQHQQQQHQRDNNSRKQHHHHHHRLLSGSSSPEYDNESDIGSYSDDDNNNSDFEAGFKFSHDRTSSPIPSSSSSHLPYQQPLKRLQQQAHTPKRYTLDDHLPIYQQSGKTTTNFDRYLSHVANASDETFSLGSSLTSSPATSRSGSPGPSFSNQSPITKPLSRQARRHEERERARIQRRLELEQAKQNRLPLFEEYKEGDLQYFEERARLKNKIRKQEALLRQHPGRAKEILRQQQQQSGEEIVYVQPNIPVNNKKKSKRERQQQLLQQLKQQDNSQGNTNPTFTTINSNNNNMMAAQDQSSSPASDMEVSSGSRSPSLDIAPSAQPAVDDLQTGADYIAFDASEDESDVFQHHQTQAGSTVSSSVAAGMKRKRGAAGGGGDDENDGGSDAEGATGPPPNCPWMGHRRYSRMKTVPVMLTQELKDFVAYLSPTREEHQVRKYVFRQIQEFVQNIWPEATVHMFGSFETMLYLPSSDLDLVVKFPWAYKAEYLHTLARQLRKENIASYCQAVSKARVPIIKMKDRITNLSIDISFNIDNGIQSAIMVRRFLEVAPGLKPLTMLVKHFLMLKDCNEPYAGGLGSYTTMIMILSFLQQHEKVRTGEIHPDDNLGPLLIEFFELYGYKFNYDNVGISVTGQGRYIRKPASAARPNQNGGRFGGGRGGGGFRYDDIMIYCEDPNDETNDTGRPSYKMRHIREVFAGAYSELSRRVQQRHLELFGKFEGGRSTSSSHIRFDDKNQVPADSHERSHGLHRERQEEKSLIHGVLSIPFSIMKSRRHLENVFYRGVFQNKFHDPHGLEGLDKIEAREAAQAKAAGAALARDSAVQGHHANSSRKQQAQHQRFVGASDTSEDEHEVIELPDDDDDDASNGQYADYDNEAVEEDAYEREFQRMLARAKEELGLDEEEDEELTANKNPANVKSSVGSIQLPQLIGVMPSSAPPSHSLPQQPPPAQKQGTASSTRASSQATGTSQDEDEDEGEEGEGASALEEGKMSKSQKRRLKRKELMRRRKAEMEVVTAAAAADAEVLAVEHAQKLMEAPKIIPQPSSSS